MMEKEEKMSMLSSNVLTSLTLSRLWPTYASAHNNLGTQLRDQSEAERHYRKAIFINDRHANAHFNLGVLLR